MPRIVKTRVSWCSAVALAAFVWPIDAQTVTVWPGVAPGSERWTQKERSVENTPIGTVIFNVVTPTLTAHLPDGAKATGTGVVIAPGGDALLAAGIKPDVHVFGAGGHGFGLRKQGTTSDHWIEILYNWLETQGLTRPRP